MRERVELDFWERAGELMTRVRKGGVLCTVADRSGCHNVLTLGWAMIGHNYQGRPNLAIVVSPPRYSWRFLEDLPEFVIAVPDDSLKHAVSLCGTTSGRDLDKFAAAELTPVPSVHVAAPSILECSINIECRGYTSIHPPHQLLSPQLRQRPIEQQHSVYFAEVAGTFGWR